MEQRKVIKNIGLRFPVLGTLVLYLCLDKWNAAEWLLGVASVLMAIIWIIVFIDKWNCQRIDIFDEKEINDKIDKPVSKFKERLKKLSKQKP